MKIKCNKNNYPMKRKYLNNERKILIVIYIDV